MLEKVLSGINNYITIFWRSRV